MKTVGAATLIAGGLLLIVSLGTLMGGITGWVVGMVFPGPIDALRGLLGLDIGNFGLGAMFGFVGGFFRTTVTKKAD